MWPYNILLYWKCSHREILPGNFWAFFRNSNYARQQTLKSGSSDWSFWKCSYERTLLQTLVKICLKVIFCSKVVTLHYAKLNSFIVCSLGFSDQNGKDLLLHSIRKPEADHITSNFLKAVFHKFYLVLLEYLDSYVYCSHEYQYQSICEIINF